MNYLPNETGYLIVDREWRDHGFGYARNEIVDVQWEGPPVALISLRQASDLAGRANPDTIKVGSYMLKRTEQFNPSVGGYYWMLVGQGEWYWLRWRVRLALDRFLARIVLTLAVWGLAEWPSLGSEPRWEHVIKRWRK